MAVLEMLAEVVGAEEFLALIALAELVLVGQMLAACDQIGLRDVGKGLSAVAAHVGGCRLARVEGRFIVLERCTGP